MNCETLPPDLTETYRDLFENAPIAYHELDADGVIVRVNARECALLGYSSDELIGKPIWSLVANEEVRAGRLALARKLSGRQPLAPFLRQYVTRDHRYITFEIRDRLIYDAAGRAVGIRSTLIDVTAKVEAENALRESARWLRTVLRSLGEAIVAIDPLGAVKFQNPVAEYVTGWPEREAAGRDIDEVVALHEGTASQLGPPVSLGANLGVAVAGVRHHSGCVRSRSGMVTDVSLTTSPIAAEKQRVVGVVLTMRKRCPNQNESTCMLTCERAPEVTKSC